jgi:hypothetical protein
MHNALKAFDSIVEIVGVYVHIGEARSFINRVHQVRTVVLRISKPFGIECCRDHCQPIVRTQCPDNFSRMIPLCGWRGGVESPG